MKSKPTPKPNQPLNGDQAGGGVSVARAGRGGGTDGIGGKDSPSDGFLFLESRLCESSGLALERFQEARKKMRADWAWGLEHGSVVYPQFGAEMVLGLVGCTAEEVATILQKSAAAATAPPKAIDARVQRMAINRRVLFAKRVDSGAIVKVLMERPKAREELHVGDVIPIWPTARPDEFECRLK